MSHSSQNSSSGYTLTANASLQSLTTFRVNVSAQYLAQLNQLDALPELLENITSEKLLVIGGGSNILFTDDFQGSAIRLATRGITILNEQNGTARVRVAAGEHWDAFVRWSLAQGFAGLENLILIPGTVGAAPMQNIGAYGVEVHEFVKVVEAWDRHEMRFVHLNNTECEFAYRDSIFKRNRERYIIVAVEFSLPRTRDLTLTYAGVEQELAVMGISEPDHAQVGAAVERIRKRKLPDPAKLGNAGSFFKNPIIDAKQADKLGDKHPAIPVYTLPDNKAKVSAAWLIEQIGFKGKREGDAGFSDKHALVLVNYGNASGAELWQLAQQAQALIADQFGIELEPEPLVL